MKDKITKIVHESFPDGLNSTKESWLVYFNETAGVRILSDNTIEPYNFNFGSNVFLYNAKMLEEAEYLMSAYKWISNISKDELKNILDEGK